MLYKNMDAMDKNKKVTKHPRVLMYASSVLLSGAYYVC